MIGKLVTRDSGSVRQFKPQIYKIGEEEKVEKVMIDVIMISEITKVGIGQIMQTEETSTGKILEVD